MDNLINSHTIVVSRKMRKYLSNAQAWASASDLPKRIPSIMKALNDSKHLLAIAEWHELVKRPEEFI